MNGTPACMEELGAHVRAGLTAPQKHLSSRWFYDDEGSRLFQRIMGLPEYYLTRVEHALLQDRAGALALLLMPNGQPIDLVELGSGDGAKVSELLRQLQVRQPAFVYRPVDISPFALAHLRTTLDQAVPGLNIEPLCADYDIEWPPRSPGHRQAVLFLGSNLGNFDDDGAVAMLRRIRARLRPDDVSLLGLDLQKDPAVILAAYNDREGVTAQFNLNVLTRLNRDLGMDFDLAQFRHYLTYSPQDGAARSYLVSRRAQRVRSTVLAAEFDFAEGETIYTEQSQKYARPMIERLAAAAGLAVDAFVTDARGWYALVACSPVGLRRG